MGKVYSMHLVALRPGVTQEEFEQFVRREVHNMKTYEGWQLSILKGDRGERKDRYLVMLEIESIAARNRFFPSNWAFSPDSARFHAQHPEVREILAKWKALATPFWEGIDLYTDYVVVESG